MRTGTRMSALRLAIAWGRHVADIYREREDPAITCIQDLPEWAELDEAINELEAPTGEAE